MTGPRTILTRVAMRLARISDTREYRRIAAETIIENKRPPRKFDWQLARQLRADGLSYRRIAIRLGVSQSAVKQACNEDYRRKTAARGIQFRERDRQAGVKA